jgi:hypothetical protein
MKATSARASLTVVFSVLLVGSALSQGTASSEYEAVKKAIEQSILWRILDAMFLGMKNVPFLVVFKQSRVVR